MDTSETTRLRALLAEVTVERDDLAASLDTARGMRDEAAERGERADALLDSAGRRVLNLTAERNGATERAERAEHMHATVLASLTHALAQGDALNAEAKDMHDRMTAAEVRATGAERERDSLRAQLDTVAEAYRALLAGQPVPEYSGPVLSERGRAVLDRVWPSRHDVAARAERERDDLAATLETRNAEHALAMEQLAAVTAERDVLLGQQAPLLDAHDALVAAARAAGWMGAGATGAELVAWVRRGGACEGAVAVRDAVMGYLDEIFPGGPAATDARWPHELMEHVACAVARVKRSVGGAT